jgi:ABC-2 type transport system ATP-binding protein
VIEANRSRDQRERSAEQLTGPKRNARENKHAAHHRNHRSDASLRRTDGGYDAARESQQVKDRIGYMAQRFGLYQDLSVQENMDFYADLFGIVGAERATLSANLLRMTRMEPFRERQAGKLSGGMKQKLALMCTLLHRPQILFLDEPTNGVDPLSRRDFWAILYQLLKDGITILMTTAYLDEAERCNRVGLMYKGRLIHCDTPEALKRQAGVDTLEAVFVKGVHAAEALEAV